MEIKVRSLDAVEPKSMQEVEQELLDKHEKEVNGEVQSGAVLDTSGIDNAAQDSQPEEDELSEEKFFHILVRDTISRLTHLMS